MDRVAAVSLSTKLHPHLPPALVLVALAACLGACTTIDETASAVFASNTPAAAVFGGRVLQGQASFTHARSGTVQLQSNDAPSLACFGPLRLTATSSGVASLSCSDGQTFAIPFQVLSPLRGSGRTQVGAAVFALTYGLQPDLAEAYLGLPEGRLVRTPP